MDCPIGQDNLAVLMGVGFPLIKKRYLKSAISLYSKVFHILSTVIRYLFVVVLQTVIRYVLASKPTPLSTPSGVAKYKS